jgi:hypothetical protein
VLGLLLAAVALSLMLLVIVFLVPSWTGQPLTPEVQLAIVIVLGVSIVMTLLFIMTAGYQRMDLAKDDQALGLPAGTVRALIAFFLILMFAIVGIYLFNAVASKGDISQQAAGLAQQLMTTIATLVVAVSGFYFGTASTARGAQIASQAARLAHGESTLQLTTTQLPDATVGQQYSFQFRADGGTSPLKWTMMASPGPAPENLSLNTNTGVLSGRPSKEGEYRFTVQVIDSTKFTDMEEFALRVNPAAASGPSGSTPASEPAGTGPTGATGPSGASGPAAGTGPTGPTAPSGASGPAAGTGPTGPTGPSGASGPAAGTGPTGPTGPSGASGPAAGTGPTGPTGPSGASGPAAGTGPTGPTGPTGATGPAGESGSTGP